MVIVSFLLRKTFKFLSDFRRTANIYAPPNPNISQNFDHRYRYPRVFIPGLESDSPSHVFGEPTASAPGHPNRPNIVPPARHRGSSYTEYPTTRPYPEEPGHSFTLPSQPYVLDASGVPHRFTTQAQPYTTVHPFRTSRPVSVIIPTTMYEPNPPERRTSAERSSVDYPNLGNVVPPSRHGASSYPRYQRMHYPLAQPRQPYVWDADAPLPHSANLDLPYTTVHPFRASSSRSQSPESPLSITQNGSLPLPVLSMASSKSSDLMGGRDILLFICELLNTIPRQLYLHILLRLPFLYFSRVALIFEDAELSMPDIKKMAIASADQWKDRPHGAQQAIAWNIEPSSVSPALANFKLSWEGFIDSLMREWKTLNLVSVLLLS